MGKEPSFQAGELRFSAYNPTGEPLTVRITRHKLLQRARLGKWMMNEVTVTVAEILDQPDAIFEGIRQEEDEHKGPGGAGWWCYVGVPSTRFVNDGAGGRKLKPSELFLVFVTDEHVAYNFRWEEVDSCHDWLRADHPDRFRSRIYLSPRMQGQAQ